ncbi:MAG: hypothetical protein GY877_05480, partial [Hyphomicrobium sp.]|nr:hypothetical protein [Hyphomicrobium sp.]
TFLRQKLKPPVGIEKPNLRHRAPPESICQASDSHKSEYGLFFEVPYSRAVFPCLRFIRGLVRPGSPEPMSPIHTPV